MASIEKKLVETIPKTLGSRDNASIPIPLMHAKDHARVLVVNEDK